MFSTNIIGRIHGATFGDYILKLGSLKGKTRNCSVKWIKINERGIAMRKARFKDLYFLIVRYLSNV
jgi:hypothetical protein